MSYNFGKNVCRYREERLLPLDELAAKARMPSSVLADIENGVHFPTLYQIERLLLALEASWRQMISNVPE